MSRVCAILHGVGLVACLLDWVTVAEIEAPILESIDELVLHPVQFQEAAALHAHWGTRLNRVPKYVIAAGKVEADHGVTLPLGGMSGLPIYDDFDPETYAAIACSKSSSASHPWRSRHNSCSSAMCAGGPPNPMQPIRVHS